MFQKILAVLDPAQPCDCILNTALSYAKVNQAQLRVITFHDVSLLEVESHPYIDVVQLRERTDQTLIDAARLWHADLIITDHAIDPALQQALPCSVLIVQQDDRTISITMQLKPPSLNLKVCNRLERLFNLTPSL